MITAIALVMVGWMFFKVSNLQDRVDDLERHEDEEDRHGDEE